MASLPPVASTSTSTSWQLCIPLGTLHHLITKWLQSTINQKPHPSDLEVRTSEEISLELTRWRQTSSNMATRVWSHNCKLGNTLVRRRYETTTTQNFSIFLRNVGKLLADYDFILHNSTALCVIRLAFTHQAQKATCLLHSHGSVFFELLRHRRSKFKQIPFAKQNKFWFVCWELTEASE
jgi:hypothetical protein